MEQVDEEEIKKPETIREAMAILREASRRMRALQRKEDIEEGLLWIIKQILRNIKYRCIYD